MNLLLDTSVVVAGVRVSGGSVAVSVITVAELEYGVLRADDPHERQRRSLRLARVKETHQAIPVDLAVAAAWSGLAQLTLARGRQPRRRAMDLLIAATAQVHGLTLVTRDEELLQLADVIDVRAV